jgi:hypothetical protein
MLRKGRSAVLAFPRTPAGSHTSTTKHHARTNTIYFTYLQTFPELTGPAGTLGSVVKTTQTFQTP